MTGSPGSYREDRLHDGQDPLKEISAREALSVVSARLVHDFNNMLTVVLGNIELMREDVGSLPYAGESLDDIARSVGRVREIMRQLQSISRTYRQGRRTGEGARLNEALERALSRIRVLAPPEVTVTAITDPTGDWRIDADAVDIEQAIFNLLLNGVQAVSPGLPGHVSARVHALRNDAASVSPVSPPHTLELEVVDDGSGMSPEVVGQMLSPFFTTKPASKGAGLGLMQLQGVLNTSGGTFGMESAPGKGTRVLIRFPVRPPDSSPDNPLD